MKKFVNEVDHLLLESLQGLQAAHRDLLQLSTDPTFVARKAPAKNKVALVSGGGAGHEPLHCGFIGRGMLDAACPGQVFTSPTPDQMLAAAAAVGGDKGVLFIVKNYAGDVMNFQMAAEMMELPCATVLVNDDVAVERSTHTTGRRGVAGTLIVEKMVGAAAEAGASLQECKALGDRINNRTASMGVAFTSCTVPAAGRPTFDIADDEMEMGMGIHGEPGIWRDKLRPADAITDEMLDRLLADMPLRKGDRASILVNSLGATPPEELYIMYRRARARLGDLGVEIVMPLVGRYATSMEMTGATVTLCRLDGELERLLKAPCHCAFWTVG
jgi:dihydroxyacetone kinase-like protein